MIGPIDGMSMEQVDAAIRLAHTDTSRPSLIVCQTVIGYGSPNKQGTGAAHGEPLGDEETILAKRQLAWPYEEPFAIPSDVLTHFRQAQEKGRELETAWQQQLEVYGNTFPAEARQLESDLNPSASCWVVRRIGRAVRRHEACRNA